MSCSVHSSTSCARKSRARLTLSSLRDWRQRVLGCAKMYVVRKIEAELGAAALKQIGLSCRRQMAMCVVPKRGGNWVGMGGGLHRGSDDEGYRTRDQIVERP